MQNHWNITRAVILHCTIVVTASFSVFPSLPWKSRQPKLPCLKFSFELTSGGSSMASMLNRNASQSVAHRSYHFDPLQAHSLKDSVNIVSVIESFGLNRFERKSPNQATAVCPFHDDKNPSLSIDGERQMFKCFGCGVAGDVFSFVREYSKLNGEEISYAQAVRYVQNTWGGVSDAPFWSKPQRPTDNAMTSVKKERLRLANAAAAAFFAECLLRPSSGAVRAYVMSRGLTASSAREFCLGYAPDSYLGRSRGAWGEGSLVQHLHKMGFSAEEILGSGLGVQVNAVKSPRHVSNGTKANSSVIGASQENYVNYTSIMDRFRNRLIVPILDGSGNHVIAFGGRVLPQSMPASSSFHPAKYLNSPETILFQKKCTLFGEYQARSHINQEKCDLILVEGYMDVIALWNVGVKEAVASMGTALSREQLTAAAAVVRSVKSRVVLCFDNDAAGIAAIERLCNGGILLDISEQYNVEFCVAELPDGIKDPDEFIALHSKQDGQESVRTLFRNEVVHRAKDWVTWYTNRIVATYNSESHRGKKGSFGDVFERIADHLATSLSPADRTHAAIEVAGTLSTILATEANSTNASDAVKSQLESDLIDLSSRIANMKNSVRLRSESSLNGTLNVNVKQVLRALANGKGPSSADDIPSLVRLKATRVHSHLASPQSLSTESRRPGLPLVRPQSSVEQVRNPGRRTNAGRRKFVEPTTSLTPHFSGFRFINKSDAEWLSDNPVGKNIPLVLGKNLSKSRHRGNEKLVYFNSDAYHGVHYLSVEAANAGYELGAGQNRDPSIVEKGIGSLLKLDTTRQAMQAENALLRMLIRHPSARTTLKNVMDARSAIGSSIDVDWSSRTKSWLFDCLMQKKELTSQSIRDPNGVRDFLAALPNCPPHAFSRRPVGDELLSNPTRELDERDPIETMTSTQTDSGTLDYLFLDPRENVRVQVVYDFRSELEVQLHYCTLLQASATRKLHHLQDEIEDVLKALSLAKPANNLDAAKVDESKTVALQTEFLQLASKLRDATQVLQSLTTSVKHLTTRQMHESNSNLFVFGRSKSLQDELASKIDEHMSNFEEHRLSPEADRFHDDKEIKETGEEIIHRTDKRWGQ